MTDPYPIEPICVGGGVVRGQRAICGRKRSDRVSTKRLVPIEDKVFLKEEGYYTPPAVLSSPEPIPVPGPSTLLEVSKEEAEFFFFFFFWSSLLCASNETHVTHYGFMRCSVGA